MWRRLLPVWVALGVVATGVFIYFAYTPTTTVHIINDTRATLNVNGCGSDPATLRPGQSVDMDPNTHDPGAACEVRQGDTIAVVGCLPIPTTRYSDGATVLLSTFRPGTGNGCRD